MGWTTTIDPSTIKEEAADYIRRNNTDRWKVLKHTLRGNVLWAVVEVSYENKPAQMAIICVLFRRWRDGVVGWKDMCESMGPYQFSVPLHYLEMVPVANQEWRDRVLAYREKQNRKFTVGEIVELVDCKIPHVRITQVKPLRGEYAGYLYRLRRGYIGKTVSGPLVYNGGQQKQEVGHEQQAIN